MPSASNEDVKSAGADLSGRQLGDYQLLRRLGRGAMAEVYLAEQKSLNRQVAVKVLKKELATDDTYVQRFQREARAVGALVHANIVQIHEVGCIDGVYFIAQEYVEGLNLKQWLSRHGTLDLRLGLIIMRQVAAALAKAADQGIIHRDIKPENIMLTSSGEVKVADFGLARMSRVGDPTDLTQVGMTLGTPLYMSPEQVEGKPLDPRSDIYSFGVTCYHVLSGSTPFAGETALNVALQHLKKRAEPLENLRPDLPPALARVVHKMLAKKPADRYQSARELLKELHRLQVEYLEDDWPEELPGLETTGVEFVNTSLGETTQQLSALMKTTTYRTPGWRWRLLWAVGLVAVFVLGGAAAYFTTSETSLLANVQKQSASVPRRENAAFQFWYAKLENTEEAWLGVGRHFPDDTLWVQRSKKQLAQYYLVHGSDDKAMEIFDEFVNLGGPNEELRAFGLAGQFAVLALEENFREAALKLDKLKPRMKGLDSSPDMKQLVRETLQNVWIRGNRETSQEWQKWLDQQFSGEETDADPP
jgi:eukaryotic-like serine/threonine-protein kinase